MIAALQSILWCLFRRFFFKAPAEAEVLARWHRCR
jgi:hypothetical protein